MRVSTSIAVILLVLEFSRCHKCLDCSKSKFNPSEKTLVFVNRNDVQYHNGTDTISIMVEHTLSESKDEECGSFPANPSCTSLGSAVIHYDSLGPRPVHSILSISTLKINNGWQCNEFIIGNTFFLDLDKNYKLTPRSGNNYQIHILSNYTFGGNMISGVQEIVQPQPLGNVSELIRALYHPDFGILELTYKNPDDTWLLIPD